VRVSATPSRSTDRPTRVARRLPTGAKRAGRVGGKWRNDTDFPPISPASRTPERGPPRAGFEVLLQENDCLLCGGIPSYPVTLGGAYAGKFPVYTVRIEIHALGFDRQSEV
jgi:hypothetical protein